MPNKIIFNKRISTFNKKIIIPGDKSLSIRWVLISSISNGVSKAQNLLFSEDVLAAIDAVRKLGIKVIVSNKMCKIYGKGINGYRYKKNLTINAKNSGTLGRLILGILIDTPIPIKMIGDKSLSKRDFKRIADPLSGFGATFRLNKNYGLPLIIRGSNKLKPIKYYEKKGSAQCKSSIMFGGIKTNGKTIIKAKKSRNHTELLCKYLDLPVTVKKKRSYDIIRVKKVKIIKSLDYNCLLYTSPSPRDVEESRMPSSA